MGYLFWLCFITLIGGLFLRIDIGGSGILATDILLPILSLVFIFRVFFIKEKVFVPSFFIPFFIFFGWAIITWILGAWDLTFTEKLLSFSHLIRIGSFLILGVVTYALSKRPEFYNNFLLNFIIIISFVLLWGFIQFFFFPDIARLSTEGGWDPHTGRLLGTWLDPNFLAGWCALLLPVFLGLFFDTVFPFVPRKTQQKFLSGLYLALIVALSLSIFLSFSRSGYLAAGLGISIFLFFRKPVLLVLILFLGITGVSVNERAQKRVTELYYTVSSIVLGDDTQVDVTSRLRIESWKKSLSLFEENAISGIGYNTYRAHGARAGIVEENYFSSGGADSSLITILITTGIIGIGLFLWFLYRILFRPWSIWVTKKSAVHLGFFSGVCALLVHSVFVNSLLFPFIFMTYIVFASYLEYPQAISEKKSIRTALPEVMR